jgi:hypothetical protein
MMLHQFTRWLRSVPVDPDMSLSLLAGELTPTPLMSREQQSASHV